MDSQEETPNPSRQPRHMELLDELEAKARRWASSDAEDPSESGAAATEWTLADDAKLATFLHEFSRHVQCRAGQVAKAVQNLDGKIARAGVDVSCASGDFLSLSDGRFVEQIVATDDDGGDIGGNALTRAGDGLDKAGEDDNKDKDADAIHLATERQLEETAILEGMAALKLFYDPANTSESDYFGLDPEDDSAYYYDSAPGDAYNQRPLPYVVGSREFLASPDAGLGEGEDEEGGDDCEGGSDGEDFGGPPYVEEQQGAQSEAEIGMSETPHASSSNRREG